ncbi:MAG: UDP-3-O-acyl-N-acetylglucosamine deacetylase [Candidatus Puniceispirillales bacterium]
MSVLDRQKTVNTSVTRSGIGLHTARLVVITIRPAPVNTGIVFYRSDLTGIDTAIPAHISNVSDVSLNTSICNSDGAEIGTIEHLMAAFAGLGIDNAYVDVSGPELPAFDGSSDRYCQMITEAGIKDQSEDRRYIKVLKPVSVELNEAISTLTPSSVLHISTKIDFSDPFIGASQYFYVHDDDSFMNELSAARTFCLYKDVSQMRAAGYAIGGSLDNAIVVKDGQMLNETPLRFTDEFVRHKTLDCLGDLRLAGLGIIGHMTASRPGHRINSELLKALFRNDSNYAIVTSKECNDTEDKVA